VTYCEESVWIPRYSELQKLLGVENIEKAALLQQAADYTKQLQVCVALSCIRVHESGICLAFFDTLHTLSSLGIHPEHKRSSGQ
jgi:hypothetical protein